jgi:transglutaminase-like putative cysteine protease
MRITVRYSASYQYAQKASFSPHRVRLFPRHDLFIHIERIAFFTDASADIQYRHDLFDNVTATCLYPDFLDRLDFELDFEAVLQEWDPFHFLLDSHALRLPFDYLPEEAAVLLPFRRSRYKTGALPASLSPAQPQPTIEAIVALNSWLHENIEYERREEGDPFTPKETLERQKASCRDFAVLLTEVLRHHGLAARLVSGYLWEDASKEHGPEHAENAFHAWVETYLPGAGWIGLDPTNGIFCDHHFLAAAVGLAPRDITPIAGHYYGKKNIASTLQTELSIVKS